MKRTLELRYRRRNGARLVSRESFVALLTEAKARKVKDEPVSTVRLGKGVYEISLLLKLLRLIPKNELLGINLLRSYAIDGYERSPAIRVSHGGNRFTLLSGAAMRTWNAIPQHARHEISDRGLPAVKIKLVEVK